MLKKPIQVFRLFSLLLIVFIAAQIFLLISYKNKELDYGEVVYQAGRQQMLVQRIYILLEEYRESPNFQSLIRLNGSLSLFTDTHKNLIKIWNAYDWDDNLFLGSLNDDIISFINEVERLKSVEFTLDRQFQYFAISKLPLQFNQVLLNFMRGQKEYTDKLQARSELLIVSLLAFVLQSFVMFFWERELV